MDPVRMLRRSFKTQGLRDTSQREGVLRYLARSRGHLALEDVYDGLRSVRPGIGRATVFRTVKLLEEMGLVSRVTLADGRSRYEYVHERRHHDHMICVRCGTALEFASAAIERMQSRAARLKRFKIYWHRHELFGLCARCSGRKST